MEEEVEYMTDNEIVMSEQEKSNHGYTQNNQHFEEKDDVDEWLNAEITKHMSMQGVDNLKDALISIIKSIGHEIKDGIMKRQFEASTASVSDEVSSIASNEVDTADDNTLNCTFHNLYATATLDAKDNFMPKRIYEYLGLDELRDTSTLENTTGTNEHLGTVNILVKFGELIFSCNFVIKMVEDVIILGRPFLESTRTQIDVFNEEISFEIGSKKFKFNIDSYQSMEKIYMEEIAKPISFSQDRRGLVERWHVCKPIHVTYGDGSGEDCGMWLTCDPDSKLCFGYNEFFGVNEQGSLRMWICFHDHERQTVKGSYMGFADFLQVRYGQQNIDDTTLERGYYEWGHQEQGDDEPRAIRPRPYNYSFEEWMKIRIGHNNLHEYDRVFIFNEWILDSYDVEEEYAREIGDPYSMRFDEYNRMFNNEIEHLSK
ncbi:phospholipase-like protein [Tanacetum coccineum]